MSLEASLDLAAAVCLVVGGLLSFAAGVGLLRFPDALSRLHAATKPQILGLIFIVVAVALSARSWSTLLVLLPVLVFQMLTAPISAHMVGRAGYRASNFRRDLMRADELAADIDKAATSEGPQESA
ncbi:MAG: monovalent cation/H(+) antiporter subunit G [Microbacteriaceae bacterium]